MPEQGQPPPASPALNMQAGSGRFYEEQDKCGNIQQSDKVGVGLPGCLCSSSWTAAQRCHAGEWAVKGCQAQPHLLLEPH